MRATTEVLHCSLVSQTMAGRCGCCSRGRSTRPMVEGKTEPHVSRHLGVHHWNDAWNPGRTRLNPPFKRGFGNCWSLLVRGEAGFG